MGGALTSPSFGKEDVRYVRTDGPGGIQQFVPGTWGVISFGIVNQGEQSAEPLATTYFEDYPNVQYGRRLWVPPRTQRASWYLVRTPAELPPEKQRANVTSLLVLRTGGQERLIESGSGRMLHDGLLYINHDRPVTCVVGDGGETEPRQFVMTTRIAAGFSNQIGSLGGDTVVPNRECLEGLDQLVVFSDRIAEDGAKLIALRRWLAGGGSVWIMLDQVRAETAALLLGDAWQGCVVDRVSLTELQIDSIRPNGKSLQGPSREFEEPVEMARVLAPGYEITHTVDGWPVAFWHPVGRGKVLFTTLSGRGWMRPRTKADPQPKSSRYRTDFMPTPPLESLSARFAEAPAPPPLAVEQIRPALMSQIGYRILSRGSVLAVLGFFCGFLLAAGIWFWRRGQLARFGWVGPVSAGLASLLLGIGGFVTRTKVPSTLSVGQVVAAVPGMQDVQLSGLLAMYNQQPVAQPIGADRGGVFSPDAGGEAGRTRRMVWTDLDRWRWENIRLPSGVRVAPFTFATQSLRPISVQATFGPQGLTGTVDGGPFTELQDAVLATPRQGRMAVPIAPDGSFSAGTTAVLSADQFLATNLLTDKQRRRNALYRQILEPPGNAPTRFPSQTTLLAWAAPLPTHFVLPPAEHYTGWTLLMVPIEFRSPAAGTQVLVPSPLVRYQSVPLPGSAGVAPTYSNVDGQWIGPLTEAAHTGLRFTVPDVVLPLTVESALLSIKIDAPSRLLRIATWHDGQKVVLAERPSPVGWQKIPIKREDVFQPDADGGLLLGVQVGAIHGTATGGITTDGWKIDEVRLEIVGRTQAAGNDDPGTPNLRRTAK